MVHGIFRTVAAIDFGILSANASKAVSQHCLQNKEISSASLVLLQLQGKSGQCNGGFCTVKPKTLDAKQGPKQWEQKIVADGL